MNRESCDPFLMSVQKNEEKICLEMLRNSILSYIHSRLAVTPLYTVDAPLL